MSEQETPEPVKPEFITKEMLEATVTKVISELVPELAQKNASIAAEKGFAKRFDPIQKAIEELTTLVKHPGGKAEPKATDLATQEVIKLREELANEKKVANEKGKRSTLISHLASKAVNPDQVVRLIGEDLKFDNERFFTSDPITQTDMEVDIASYVDKWLNSNKHFMAPRPIQGGVVPGRSVRGPGDTAINPQATEKNNPNEWTYEDAVARLGKIKADKLRDGGVLRT